MQMVEIPKVVDSHATASLESGFPKNANAHVHNQVHQRVASHQRKKTFSQWRSAPPPKKNKMMVLEYMSLVHFTRTKAHRRTAGKWKTLKSVPQLSIAPRVPICSLLLKLQGVWTSPGTALCGSLPLIPKWNPGSTPVLSPATAMGS